MKEITEVQLKNRVGIFLIISHFTIMFLVVVLYLFGGFLFEEMTTSISLIVPMFATYTTAIIKYIIKTKEQVKVKSKKLTSPFVFISFMIPSLFILFIVCLIFLKAFNVGFSTFEQFKIMLVASETMFGAYVGLIISSLFEVKEEGQKDKKGDTDGKTEKNESEGKSS